MKVLVDTNILIDFLEKREPFYDEAEKILTICAHHIVQGFVAANSITDAFYILRKMPKEDRRSGLLDIFNMVSVIGIDQKS